MDENKWFKLELFGIIFVFLGGLGLYYCYAASNKAVWAMLFGLVNESIWEHVKIFTMPYIIWSFVEFCFICIKVKKFLTIKIISVYIIIIGTICAFSIYYGVVGYHILIVDMLVSFILISSATFFSYKSMIYDVNLNAFFIPAIILFIIFIFMYFMFTVLPPRIHLFCDPITNAYGIY